MTLAPALIAFFVEQYMWSRLPGYMLGSPMVLATDDSEAIYSAGGLVAVWGAMAAVASSAWFREQWRRFVPYEGPEAVGGSARDEPVTNLESEQATAIVGNKHRDFGEVCYD